MCGTLGPQDLDFFYQKLFQFSLSFSNILKKAKQTMTQSCDRGAGNAHLRQAVAKPELDVRPWQKPWEPHVCTFEVLNTSKKLFSTPPWTSEAKTPVGLTGPILTQTSSDANQNPGLFVLKVI